MTRANQNQDYTDVGIIWQRYKAAIIKMLQEVRANSLEMRGIIGLSKEIRSYQEEPNGNFRIEK